MNQSSLLAEFGDPITRVENALQALREGRGVLLLDDEDRENEGDIIYAVESLTTAQMALMIRECSGIVCLCLTEAQADRLALPPMVVNNNSANQTAFTVSIEAKHGVTTGGFGARSRHHHQNRRQPTSKAGRFGASRPCIPTTCSCGWGIGASWSYRRYG